MALELLHKFIEELTFDVVCQRETVRLGKLGEHLREIFGRSPKSFSDCHVYFQGDESPKNLPKSLRPFVQSIPHLQVDHESVKISESPDGQRAVMAWRSSREVGNARYRSDILKCASQFLLHNSLGPINPSQIIDDRGNTLLHLVAGLPSNTEFFDRQNQVYLGLLVRNGADLRVRNRQGFTPIQVLCRRTRVDDQPSRQVRSAVWPAKNRARMLEAMIIAEMRVSKDERESCAMVPGPNGNILHEWVLSSVKAENVGDELLLGRLIVDQLGIPAASTSYEGCTPLHYAYDDEVFEFLLRKEPHEHRNSVGETPLLSVIKRGIVDGKNRDKLLRASGRLSNSIERIISMIWKLNLSVLARDRQGNHAIDVLLRSLMDGTYEAGEIQQVCATLESLFKAACPSRDLIAKNKVNPTAMVNTIIDCIESIYAGNLDQDKELVDVSSLLNVMDMLLENGANPNHVVHGTDATTFLHKCCSMQGIPVNVADKLISILRTQGAKGCVVDGKGLTPQQILMRRDGPGITELLMTLNGTRPKKLLKVQFGTEIHRKALEDLCVSGHTTVECYRYDPAVCIGRGAIGRVFPAIDERGKRGVALKRIEKDYNDKTVKTEIQALCKLGECKQIVDYFHIIDNDPLFYYIVLELMEGDLADLIHHQRPALNNDSTVVKLVGDAVEGLKYLHKQPNGGILHRDLKPGNVLYTNVPELCLKLSDFGLAKDTTVDSTLTTTSGHSLTGTRGWMAPELVSRQQTRHTKETDIFSLGLVLHFLMSKGKHPFDVERSVLTKDTASAQRLLPHKLEQAIISGTDYMDLHELAPAGYDLLKRLLSLEMGDRPNAAIIDTHCFFWDVHKKVQFLMAVGDQPELAKPYKHAGSGVCKLLESTKLATRLRDIPWDTVIPDLYNGVTQGKYHYDTTSLTHLVRFFRNAFAHEEEQSSQRKAELKCNIFFRKFPSLLLTVWGIVLGQRWHEPKPNRERQRIQRALSMQNTSAASTTDPSFS